MADDFEDTAKTFGVTEFKTNFFGKRCFFINDPDGQPVEIRE